VSTSFIQVTTLEFVVREGVVRLPGERSLHELLARVLAEERRQGLTHCRGLHLLARDFLDSFEFRFINIYGDSHTFGLFADVTLDLKSMHGKRNILLLPTFEYELGQPMDIWFFDRSVLLELESVMPRKLRVEYPGALNHVMSCGDRRESLTAGICGFLSTVDVLRCKQNRWMKQTRLCCKHFL
jgi:hypothetical protein